MGYFSNIEEVREYEGKWCSKCVNNPDKCMSEGFAMCSVMFVHLSYGHKYSEDNANPLEMLIPRKSFEGCMINQKCKMFLEVGV